MDTLSTPVLSADLPAYVADLAARVERLEQQNRPQWPSEHVHASVSGPHSHGIDVGQHYHNTVSTDCEPKMEQHKLVASAYMQ